MNQMTKKEKEEIRSEFKNCANFKRQMKISLQLHPQLTEQQIYDVLDISLIPEKIRTSIVISEKKLIDEIRRLAALGYNKTEISREIGCNKSLVWVKCKQYGITADKSGKARREHSSLVERRARHAIKMVESGISISRAAESCGVSISTVSRYMKQEG